MLEISGILNSIVLAVTGGTCERVAISNNVLQPVVLGPQGSTSAPLMTTLPHLCFHRGIH